MAAACMAGQIVVEPLHEEQAPPPKVVQTHATNTPAASEGYMTSYTETPVGSEFQAAQCDCEGCAPRCWWQRLCDSVSCIFSRRLSCCQSGCSTCGGGCCQGAANGNSCGCNGPEAAQAPGGQNGQGGQGSATVPTKVAKRFADRVGHEADYSWVTGQLHYIHADGGLWVVRYAGVDSEDQYGGSVVLAPTVNMKNFRDGDLVSVHGEVVNPGRASKFLGGPLYRPVSVDMVERAD
jgi:hypothetical protein